MRNLGATLWAELLEEAPDGLGAPTFASPDQWSTAVVVDHHQGAAATHISSATRLCAQLVTSQEV